MASNPKVIKRKVARRVKSSTRIAVQAGPPKAAARGAQADTRSRNTQATTIFARMGRWLGERIESEADLVRIVGAGLPSSALNRLIDEIDLDIRLIGPETTVRRRLLEKQHFTSAESERLVRLARITSMAEALLGDTATAAAWLSTRSNFVPGAEPVSPLSLATTDSGARMIEALMLRTAHGVF